MNISALNSVYGEETASTIQNNTVGGNGGHMFEQPVTMSTSLPTAEYLVPPTTRTQPSAPPPNSGQPRQTQQLPAHPTNNTMAPALRKHYAAQDAARSTDGVKQYARRHYIEGAQSRPHTMRSNTKQRFARQDATLKKKTNDDDYDYDYEQLEETKSKRVGMLVIILVGVFIVIIIVIVAAYCRRKKTTTHQQLLPASPQQPQLAQMQIAPPRTVGTYIPVNIPANTLAQAHLQQSQFLQQQHQAYNGID